MKGILLIILAILITGCSHSKRASSKSARHSDGAYCKPLTVKDRVRIISLAQPKRFIGAKYKMGPRRPANLEKETDCSRFVHEIYKRAGFPYDFRTTSTMLEASEFDEIDEDDAKPGDIMLFRGHMGILNNDGKIISATYIRSRKQPSTVTLMNRENFKTFRGKRYVLRYRCKSSEKGLEYADR